MSKEFLEVNWFESIKINTVLEENGNKKYLISGPFTKCDFPNGNNRVYPKKIMDDAINKLRPRVTEGRVRMMVDHPLWDSSLSKVGALVKNITNVKEDGYAYYEAQIIDTAVGKDLKAILDAGGKLGVSTRGTGRCDYDKEVEGFPGKYDVICEGYELSTFDFVDDPAVSDTEAYCHIESKRRSTEMKTIQEMKKAYPAIFEKYESELKQSHQKELDEAKVASKATLDEATEKATKLGETVKSLTESIKDVCPEIFTTVEESTQVGKMQVENEKLVKELNDSKTALENAQAEIKTVKDVAITDAKDAKVKELEAKHVSFFEMAKSVKSLEGIFDTCVTAEEVEQVLESNLAVYNEIKKSSNESAEPKSKLEDGKNTDDAKKTVEGLDESQTKSFNLKNKLRRNSGLTPFTVEKYKSIFVTN